MQSKDLPWKFPLPSLKSCHPDTERSEVEGSAVAFSWSRVELRSTPPALKYTGNRPIRGGVALNGHDFAGCGKTRRATSFVSGHDFSRAEYGQNREGFSP